MEQSDPYLKTFENLLGHIRHIEARSFASLGNFLTANAFMLAAWATLLNFRQSTGLQADISGLDWILLLMTTAGYLAGCGWGLLGARNWEYVRRLVAESIRIGFMIEAQPGYIGKNLYNTLRDVERRVHKDWKEASFAFSISSHEFLASRIPLFVSFIHLSLFIFLAFDRRFPLQSEPNYWVAGLAAALGTGWLVHIWGFVISRADEAKAEIKRARDEIGEEEL